MGMTGSTVAAQPWYRGTSREASRALAHRDLLETEDLLGPETVGWCRRPSPKPSHRASYIRKPPAWTPNPSLGQMLFKTGRPEQPSGCVVRFHRRSVGGFVPG